ncbi:TonB-dependent receptor [Pseudoalteromonas luteoviolacea]|uniref:TonB-dependent receptor n=1 Tax=Pseudoalteromonas luteoviolacea TaxID=43657 RepID=A0A0C1QBK3_9GAMM|nr:TonB-dependent receptor [Pseudoalteromonas luteoviolacea]KID56790.1 TonB-dependent receptor [Pseudoalteromonas luteoviolacea]
MFKLSAISISIFPIMFSPILSYAADDSMEVIEVYAQKRKQNIEDVSVSISTIGANRIARQGIKDATELGHFVANLKVSQNAAEGTPPAINIRGVGLLDYNTANTSPVAMYVDGLSVGSANNQIANLFDIEQVEVLKGPQGTLFGRNSTGGALLVRTKRPDDGNYGYVKLGAGTDDWYRAQGAYNATINDESAVRFAFNHTDYEYTSYNLLETSPEAGLTQSDLRLSYLGEWDKWSAFVKGYYGHWDGIVQPVGSIGVFKDPNPDSPVLCSPREAGSLGCVDNFGFNDGSDDFWAVRVNNDSPHLSIYKGWGLELQWEVQEGSYLTYINGFNRLDRDHAFNCDGSPARLCEGELGLKSELVTNELRYQGQFDDDYWTVGLFHLEERIYQNNHNDILRDLRGVLAPELTTTFFYDNEIVTKTIALFSQYEWRLSEQHMITFGARYSDESVKYDSISRLNFITTPGELDGTIIPFYTANGEVKDDRVSGKLAWNYSPNDDLLIYYSLANGTKSGGYNGGLLSSPEQAEFADYEPEELIAHEAGFKLSNDDVYLLSGAIFYYDYKEQQVFMNQASSTPNAPPLQLLENVGKSTIYGAELELEYLISNHLSSRLAIGYIPEANFEEFIDPVGVALTDNRLPFTSEWNIAAELAYTYPLYEGELSSVVGVDYQSEYYFDQNQNPYAMQSGYALWRANITYQYKQWQLGVWGKNLFDKEYSHLKFDLRSFLGMLEDFKGEGQRIGVDITYNF